MLKEQHLNELNKLKIEYGKDLSILHKTQKQREFEIRDEMNKLQIDEIDSIIK